jgi:hypothetical protein
MKISKILAITGMLISFASPIVAANAAPTTSIPCPVCKMPMTTTKQGINTAALLVHGKKYYCCTMCSAGKAAAAYDKTHKGKIFVAVK